MGPNVSRMLVLSIMMLAFYGLFAFLAWKRGQKPMAVVWIAVGLLFTGMTFWPAYQADQHVKEVGQKLAPGAVNAAYMRIGLQNTQNALGKYETMLELQDQDGASAKYLVTKDGKTFTLKELKK